MVCFSLLNVLMIVAVLVFIGFMWVFDASCRRQCAISCHQVTSELESTLHACMNNILSMGLAVNASVFVGV